MANLKSLQEALEHSFSRISYLRTALTHKSAGKTHYEKLEFLGDSILTFAISDLLLSTHPDLNEGALSISRSRLVNKYTLSHIGKSIDLDRYIKTSLHQAISPSIRADVVEAIIGACYLDSDIMTTQALIKKLFLPLVTNLNTEDIKDSKSLLQEHAHKTKLPGPRYQVLSTEGKEHERVYTIACTFDGITATESYHTKRRAEMLAARSVLQQLEESVNA